MTAHRHFVVVLSVFFAIGAQGCGSPEHASDAHLSGHDAQTQPPAATTIEGLWHEDTPTACQQGKGDTTAEPLRELKFDGGKFFVTWMPFETYVDYWGPYTYDAATGALSLTVESGNWIPPDAHLKGTARIDPDGKLQITGIFFGTPGGTERKMIVHSSDCPLVFKH